MAKLFTCWVMCWGLMLGQAFAQLASMISSTNIDVGVEVISRVYVSPQADSSLDVLWTRGDTKRSVWSRLDVEGTRLQPDKILPEENISEASGLASLPGGAIAVLRATTKEINDYDQAIAEMHLSEFDSDGTMLRETFVSSTECGPGCGGWSGRPLEFIFGFNLERNTLEYTIWGETVGGGHQGSRSNVIDFDTLDERQWGITVNTSPAHYIGGRAVHNHQVQHPGLWGVSESDGIAQMWSKESKRHQIEFRWAFGYKPNNPLGEVLAWGTGWFVSFSGPKTDKLGWQSYGDGVTTNPDIGVIFIDSQNSDNLPDGTQWITDTPSVLEKSVHLAFYGPEHDKLVLFWQGGEGEELRSYLVVLNTDLTVVSGPEDITAVAGFNEVPQLDTRFIFTSVPNGDIVWVTYNMQTPDQVLRLNRLKFEGVVAGGWTAWGPCYCDTNLQKRACTKPLATNGGAMCAGATEQACTAPCVDVAMSPHEYPVGHDPATQDPSGGRFMERLLNTPTAPEPCYVRHFERACNDQGWISQKRIVPATEEACWQYCDAREDCNFVTLYTTARVCRLWASCTIESSAYWTGEAGDIRTQTFEKVADCSKCAEKATQAAVLEDGCYVTPATRPDDAPTETPTETPGEDCLTVSPPDNAQGSLCSLGEEISATLGVLTAPMQIYGDYISTPNEGVKGSSYTEPPTGGATFSVLASTSTTVELECEVLTPTISDDSFFVWFDDAPFFLWQTDDHQSFEWTPVGSTFALSAGMHTLHIGLREDGAKMRALRISSGDAVFTREGGEGGEGGEGQTCPTLSPPANAQGSSPCTASTEADTCTFICATGFQATNSQGTRTCQGDGTWGGEDLTCEAVVCPELPLPTNAVDSISTDCLNGLEGDVCSYACEIGYSDNGYESRTCSEGEWTGQNLVCTSIPCPLLPVPDGGAGAICADKVQGDVCAYTCLDGYVPLEMGLDPRQCDQGEWVGPALTCTEVGNCIQLAAPVGAVAQTCTAKVADETCEFTCDVGYEPATSTRTCQSDLSWDGEDFQCTPQSCPALTAPANAVDASCMDKLHQDTCTFACKTGFSDNGFSARMCEGGVWSGIDLVCAPKNCPDLDFPDNVVDGSVACEGKAEPETCTFTCAAGVKTTGDPTRTCQAGAWTGFSLVCTEADYTFIASDWGACDEACGGGQQTRTVSCIDVGGGDNEVVDVALCADKHDVANVQTCNEEPCVTYTWVPGAWGDCGASCGGSEQTRAVACEATEDGSTASVSVAVELCTDSVPKPPTSQTCQTQACVDNHWVLGEWASCSAECDGGVQTRVVGCRDPKGNALLDAKCDDEPDTEQDCNTHSCSTTTYEWALCNWDACTAQCGGAGTEGGLMAGELHRDVYCTDGEGVRVPSAACAEAGAIPITSIIGCNRDACDDYNWMTTVWSQCTDNVRERTRHCHGADGSNAVDEKCNPSIAPELMDTQCQDGMCSTFVALSPTINLASSTTAWPAAIIVLAATLRVLQELV